MRFLRECADTLSYNAGQRDMLNNVAERACLASDVPSSLSVYVTQVRS